MAFADLENGKSWGRKCPHSGVLVTTREVGSKGKRTRYLAVLLGADVAKAINLAGKEANVRVQIGNGQDENKLRIALAPTGKFNAKRQMGGGWLVTVRQQSLERGLKAAVRYVIEAPRHVPANSGEPPCTIISIREALA